jgi:hypothetical protein
VKQSRLTSCFVGLLGKYSPHNDTLSQARNDVRSFNPFGTVSFSTFNFQFNQGLRVKPAMTLAQARQSALDAESPENRSLIIMGLRVKPAMTLAHARHSALDAESPENRSLIIMGLRVKPAMTIPYF